jgi:hypothetical protein
LFAVLGDVEDPIVAFTGQTVGGCARWNRSAVNGNGERAGEGAEARIDHIGDTADCDSEEHVLARAFVARFEEEDTGGVSDGGEHRAQCLVSALSQELRFGNAKYGELS